MTRADSVALTLLFLLCLMQAALMGYCMGELHERGEAVERGLAEFHGWEFAWKWPRRSAVPKGCRPMTLQGPLGTKED